MSNDAWVKYFSDGFIEIGSDSLISKKLASWSKGRLDSISAVSICGFNKSIKVEIPNTEWYQFDRYVVDLSLSSNNKVFRGLQFKIEQSHLNSYLCYNINKNGPNSLLLNETNKNSLFSIKIKEEMTLKWITVILSKEKIDFYIGDRKGSINDSNPIFR